MIFDSFYQINTILAMSPLRMDLGKALIGTIHGKHGLFSECFFPTFGHKWCAKATRPWPCTLPRQMFHVRELPIGEQSRQQLQYMYMYLIDDAFNIYTWIDQAPAIEEVWFLWEMALTWGCRIWGFLLSGSLNWACLSIHREQQSTWFGMLL